jgi:hypothetical protein
MPLEISTAENLSNLAWVVFAVSCLVLWRQWVFPELGGRSGRSLCALLSVLLLMFPIISISDDLHPDLVAAVEGESKSRLLKPVDAPHRAAGSFLPAAVFALLPASPLCGPATVILERLQPVLYPVNLFGESSSQLFRGPPSSRLS